MKYNDLLQLPKMLVFKEWKYCHFWLHIVWVNWTLYDTYVMSGCKLISDINKYAIKFKTACFEKFGRASLRNQLTTCRMM